jgi:MFS family permease
VSRVGPLQERNFRNLWIGRTASVVGDSLSFVALAFAVIGLGGSGTDLGLVIASYSLPSVIFLLVGGVWADRLPRRAVMIAADVVRAGAQLTLAVAVLTGNASVPLFMAMAFVSGASTAFFQPASTGLVPEAVSAARLQQGNALLNLSQSIAQLFGPVVSGLLVIVIGAGWVFAIDAATFLISAAALASLRLRLAPRAAHGSFLADLRVGWREVVSRRWLPPSLAAFSLMNLSFASFLTLGPIVMNEQYGGAADWGFVVAMFGVGGLLGGGTALRWKPARPLIAVFALMTFNALRLVGLSITPPLLIVLGFVLVASAASSLGDTIWHTTVQTQVPARHLSRVSSYDWMVSLLFFPLGAALAGPLADTVGASNALTTFAILSSVPCVLVLLLPAVRGVRRAERPPLDAAESPLDEPGAQEPAVEPEATLARAS